MNRDLLARMGLIQTIAKSAESANTTKRSIDFISRLALVHARCAAGHGMLRDIVQRDFPRDELVRKAAVSPHTISTTQDLLGFKPSDPLVLAPASAAAQVLTAGLKISFDGVAQAQLPAYVTASTFADFVAEAAPIKVKGLTLTAGLILEPKKFALIVPLTREVVEQSNGEQVVRQVLQRAASLALDAKVLDDVAADTTRPAGLLNGVVAETAEAVLTGQSAMIADVSTLTAALAAKGGGVNVAFIADPATAMRMKLWSPPRFDSPIYASNSLAADTLIAVEQGAIASGWSDMPEISASTQALLHMEDTSPAEIVSATGPTTANPVRSLFQTDCIALKMVLRCSWAVAGGLIAWIDGVNW